MKNEDSLVTKYALIVVRKVLTLVMMKNIISRVLSVLLGTTMTLMLKRIVAVDK
jgi:hypothetical protein